MEIPDSYTNQFDCIFFTIGTECWFQNMIDFFAVVRRCLKPGGVYLLNETHPFTEVFAYPMKKSMIKIIRRKFSIPISEKKPGSKMKA